MVKKSKKVVEISPNAYFSMTGPTIEKLYTEVAGYLYGKKEKDRFLIFSSNSIQTVKSTEDSVYHANRSAQQRLKEHDLAIMGSKKFSSYRIGGFHSHTEKYSRLITNEDIKYASDIEMPQFNLEEWIEVTLKIMPKEYLSDMEIGINPRIHNGRIIDTIRGTPRKGYYIITTPYLITNGGSVEEINFKLKRPQIQKRKNW